PVARLRQSRYPPAAARSTSSPSASLVSIAASALRPGRRGNSRPDLILQISARLAEQAEESRAAIAPATQVVQVTTFRQLQRTPATADRGGEPLRALTPTAIGIECAPHHARPRQPPKSVRRQRGAARRKRWQPPADGGEPVKDTLDQKRLAPP